MSAPRTRGQVHSEKNYPSAPRAKVGGKHAVLAIDSLRANPWNYNVQTEDEFAKLLASMRRHGFGAPIVVRTLAKGVREIINGEHRWRAARELGHRTVPVFDLGKLDDAAAKQLCIVLNELNGVPDEVRLADLLRDLAKQSSVAELAVVMPYSERELEHLVGSVNFTFSNLPAMDSRTEAEQRENLDPDAPAELPPPAAFKPEASRVALVYPLALGELVLERLRAIDADPTTAVLALLEDHASAPSNPNVTPPQKAAR